MSIGLSPGGCCCSAPAPTCDSCPACPSVNLCSPITASWVNGQIGGGDLACINNGDCTWDSQCQPPLRFVLDMTGPTAVLHVYYYSPFSDCTAGTPAVACTFTTTDSFNCNPFLASWPVTSANCPGLFSLGYTRFTASR